MTDILLTTLNARYIHASLGLRYLYANLGERRASARIVEFTLEQRPAEIAERLLSHAPRIIGLGVYIWNAEESLRLVALLKRIAPEVTVVVGGPEVSHEWEGQPIVALADHLVVGPGELAFADLCERLLAGERPAEKMVRGEAPPDRIVLPYRHYSDEDIGARHIYVEASRGCPFRCDFCLSALDRGARPFDPDRFLGEMEALLARGARRFKFVDRTFNLNVKAARRLLEFFLARLDERLFLHFEVIPDRLPEPLKESLAKFPPGALQLEIGVQSFNPEVQRLINRLQDNDATEANLRWLREATHAHLHADLIAGLPGEDLPSFGAGFDRLLALRPHEIQVGILKRLRGAPIARHAAAFDLRFNPHPPYEILATDRIDFPTMQRLARFARYWDLVGNSGRFPESLPRLLGDAPFARFLAFSDWLYDKTGQTSRIALPRLFELLHEHLVARGEPEDDILDTLARDGAVYGAKGCPAILHPRLAAIAATTRRESHAPDRQARHLKHPSP